jgi:hypothetical protein
MGQLTGHRYLVVFLVNSWAENRNSGIGWEPAVFGAILSWAILMNLFIYKKSINIKLIILFIAAVTTFSIGTFVTLFVIFLFFILNKKKKILYIILGITFSLIISSISFYKETLTRLDNYVAETNEEAYLQGEGGNRIDALIIGAKEIIAKPWGYGIRSEKPDFMSFPNGFVSMIFRFGIPGLIVMFILLFKLFNVLNYYFSTNFKGRIVFILAIIITLNGNPLSYQEIMFSLLLSGYIFQKLLVRKNITQIDYIIKNIRINAKDIPLGEP